MFLKTYTMFFFKRKTSFSSFFFTYKPHHHRVKLVGQRNNYSFAWKSITSNVWSFLNGWLLAWCQSNKTRKTTLMVKNNWTFQEVTPSIIPGTNTAHNRPRLPWMRGWAASCPTLSGWQLHRCFKCTATTRQIKGKKQVHRNQFFNLTPPTGIL